MLKYICYIALIGVGSFSADNAAHAYDPYEQIISIIRNEIPNADAPGKVRLAQQLMTITMTGRRDQYFNSAYKEGEMKLPLNIAQESANEDQKGLNIAALAVSAYILGQELSQQTTNYAFDFLYDIQHRKADISPSQYNVWHDHIQMQIHFFQEATACFWGENKRRAVRFQPYEFLTKCFSSLEDIDQFANMIDPVLVLGMHEKYKSLNDFCMAVLVLISEQNSQPKALLGAGNEDSSAADSLPAAPGGIGVVVQGAKSSVLFPGAKPSEMTVVAAALSLGAAAVPDVKKQESKRRVMLEDGDKAAAAAPEASALIASATVAAVHKATEQQFAEGKHEAAVYEDEEEERDALYWLKKLLDKEASDAAQAKTVASELSTSAGSLTAAVPQITIAQEATKQQLAKDKDEEEGDAFDLLK